MIVSPKVPFFRSDNGDLLKEPFNVSVITAPAVNAGVIFQKQIIADLKERKLPHIELRGSLEERIAIVESFNKYDNPVYYCSFFGGD